MTEISLNGSDWLFKGFIGEDWLLRKAHLPGTRDVLGWHPASVPGSVIHDLWWAGLVPDPYYEMNSLRCEWASQRTWVYKKAFLIDPSWRGKRVLLVFEGVDYAARFFLNGEPLGHSTGMFLKAAFDVGERLNMGGENLLSLVIDPAPPEQPQVGYTSRVYTQKVRMNYWWDFCPRLVHQGIWQDVFLRVTGPARLDDLHIRPDLSVDLLRASVEAEVQIDKPANVTGDIEINIKHVGEDKILQGASMRIEAGEERGQAQFRIDQPDLWWPNGLGAQPLYEAEARVSVDGKLSDTRTTTFGIRQIEFTPNEGAASGALPYNLVVNGRKIYIQGWNWVPADALYGIDLTVKREHLLRLAKNAHVNLLRVWGGGLIEKEAFYDVCDRLGILVWQEFIQSSSGIDNVPSDAPAFIRFLVSNAGEAIIARRNHPSLAVWCGGNELHYDPTHLCGNEHPALASLQDAVSRLDPGRHWVPSSPAGGVFAFAVPKTKAEASALQDVHGPWEYQGLREQYALYNGGRSLLHSEFGVEGITNARTLDQTIAAEHQHPASLTNPVWHHLGAWWVKEGAWQEVFGGPFPDVAAAIRATQFMQAEGLRYAVEADRRRMYQNGGSMPWQFNEPYPMAACTSAVDYYGEPKPVYYAVSRAYRPLSLSARFPTIAWAGESQFSASLWCANAGMAQEGMLNMTISGTGGEIFYESSNQSTLPENGSAELAKLALPLERISTVLFFLSLEWIDLRSSQVSNSRYLFTKSGNLAPVIGPLPLSHLNAAVQKDESFWQVTLENPTRMAALGIWMEAEKNDLSAPAFAYFSDNYFCLLPGERRTIRVEWSGLLPERRAIQVRGWNFAALRLE